MTSGAQNQQRPSSVTSSRPGSRNLRASRTIHVSSLADLSSNSELQQDRQALLDEQNGGPSFPQSVNEQLEAPADFRPSATNPYFTLIEDTATGEHYHPSVHYIFEDDEPDLLLAASVRILGGNEDYRSPVMDKSEGAEYEPVLLPPPAPGTEERYIVLNMASNGYSAESAHSLSPNWQISNVKVSEAPTWDDDVSNTQSNGLMLGIRGSGLPMRSDINEEDGEKLLMDALGSKDAPLMAGIENLVTDFKKGQAIINSIVGADQKVEPSVAAGGRILQDAK